MRKWLTCCRGSKRWLPIEEPWPNGAIATTIEPREHGRVWYWEADYLSEWEADYLSERGLRCPMTYSEWFCVNHPRPLCVAGTARTHAEARADLARAVNAMRARLAAVTSEHNHRQARGHRETVRP